jgi:hypothetical protein
MKTDSEVKEVKLNNQPRTHEKIPKSNKMTSVLHLFGKNVCKIETHSSEYGNDPWLCNFWTS